MNGIKIRTELRPEKKKVFSKLSNIIKNSKDD